MRFSFFLSLWVKFLSIWLCGEVARQFSYFHSTWVRIESKMMESATTRNAVLFYSLGLSEISNKVPFTNFEVAWIFAETGFSILTHFDWDKVTVARPDLIFHSNWKQIFNSAWRQFLFTWKNIFANFCA